MLSTNVVDFRGAREQRFGKVEKTSTSLKKVTRKFRRELLQVRDYQRLWAGQLTKDQYLQLLYANLQIRRALEQALDSLGDTCYVRNLFEEGDRPFSIGTYLNFFPKRSATIELDIDAITGDRSNEFYLQEKTDVVVDYIMKVKTMYPAALLGILYMLEETITFAGPKIAAALDNNLGLNGHGIAYLLGSVKQKSTLWAFAQSLDDINDFQTQANIVIAATMTYGRYQPLLNPKKIIKKPVLV